MDSLRLQTKKGKHYATLNNSILETEKGEPIVFYAVQSTDRGYNNAHTVSNSFQLNDVGSKPRVIISVFGGQKHLTITPNQGKLNLMVDANFFSESTLGGCNLATSIFNFVKNNNANVVDKNGSILCIPKQTNHTIEDFGKMHNMHYKNNAPGNFLKENTNKDSKFMLYYNSLDILQQQALNMHIRIIKNPEMYDNFIYNYFDGNNNVIASSEKIEKALLENSFLLNNTDKNI